MSLCQSRRDWPDVADGTCCFGAGVMGPDRCTCWKPEHDIEQAPLDEQDVELLRLGVPPSTRDELCTACAYRPGSPEKTGAEGYNGNAEELDDLAVRGQFFCHEGMRCVTQYVHPAGVAVEGHPADYDPPYAHGVPFKADGTAAELCAGWRARRRALLAPRPWHVDEDVLDEPEPDGYSLDPDAEDPEGSHRW